MVTTTINNRSIKPQDWSLKCLLSYFSFNPSGWHFEVGFGEREGEI